MLKKDQNNKELCWSLKAGHGLVSGKRYMIIRNDVCH